MSERETHMKICNDVKEYLASHHPGEKDYPKTKGELYKILDIENKYQYAQSSFYHILSKDLKCRQLNSGKFILDSEDDTLHFSELYKYKKYNTVSCFLFDDSELVPFFANYLNKKYKKQKNFHFVALQDVLICLHYCKANAEDSISKADVKNLVNETFAQMELVL